MPYCFVRFAVSNRDRYLKLHSAFEAIKHDKEAGRFRDVADWLAYFDEAALQRFWWPTREEMAAYDPQLPPPSWDFESLFAAFDDGDYDLLSCERVNDELGEIRFASYGYPYGGTDCFHMLIQAFGFTVIGEDDGTGYHEVDA